MKNLDSEQLDLHIKKMKDKIYNQMNLTNFDPIFLQSLDSKQLDALIKRISLDLAGLNTLVGDSLKKNNDTILNELTNSSNTNYPYMQNQFAQVTKVTKESNNNNNNIIIIDDSNSNNTNPKYHDILIKSQDYDNPENYNDYMVEFKDNPYRNVTSFQLIDMKVPQVANIITSHSNKLRYIIDEQETEVDVIVGSYNSYTLIQALQKLLSPNFSITSNNEGRVTITNDFNKSFDIINNGKSVLRHLGFSKVNYIGRKTYTAEDLPSINKRQDIYLFIEGVLDDRPILSYNQNDDISKLCPITVKFDKPLESLPEIFIKFKTDNNTETNNLVDFHEQPHELRFRIGCL
jgi:hypothetical protein